MLKFLVLSPVIISELNAFTANDNGLHNTAYIDMMKLAPYNGESTDVSDRDSYTKNEKHCKIDDGIDGNDTGVIGETPVQQIAKHVIHGKNGLSCSIACLWTRRRHYRATTTFISTFHCEVLEQTKKAKRRDQQN